jgi:hypothetical protein
MSYRLFEVRVDLKATSFLRTTEMTQRANNVGAPPPRRDLRRHIHHHRPDGVQSTFRADGTLKEFRDLNDNVIAFTWGPVPGVAPGGPPRLLK